MRYLLALPLLYLAGFLWQLGRDSAEAVKIVATRKARARRRDEVETLVREEARAETRAEARARLSYPDAELGCRVYYVADGGAARWTVQ